jgi:hypothetical protein
MTKINVNALTTNIDYEKTFLSILRHEGMIDHKEFQKFDRYLTEIRAYHDRVTSVKGEYFETDY